MDAGLALGMWKDIAIEDKDLVEKLWYPRAHLAVTDGESRLSGHLQRSCLYIDGWTLALVRVQNQ